MADIRPLRALRYDASRIGDLSRVLSPPYDVLSRADEEALRAAHPRNFVRLILPREEGGLDRYRASARLLSDWRADGTLRRDPAPAFYFYEQEYRLRDPAPFRRRGIFTLVRLHDFSEGIVLPHEQTLPGPREDRYRLLEATEAHFDPIFGLYSDPGGTVERLFTEAARGPAIASAAVADGVAHRLWATERTADLSAIRAALDGKWVLIADGHHRYESALRYARGRSAPAGATRSFDYVLMVLCSIESRGLTVLPIHRLVHSLPVFRPAEWMRALEAWFERRELDLPADRARAAQAIEEALAPQRAAGGAFVAATSTRQAHVLELRPGFDRDSELGDRVPAPLRGLDVSLAHTLILERALSITPEQQLSQARLRYSKDAASALAELDSGAIQAALFMNPTPIEAVVEVTRSGLRLPPKSTFFHPKMISGLVIHPFDDEG
jgi:uncharacterized protein (DUF1015 family)